MPVKKSLMFIIPSLEGGGAEKVLVNIITTLDRRTYRIILVLFNKKGVLLEKIPSTVEIYNLEKKSKYSIFNLVIKLTLLIRKLKPQNVIGFMHYVNMITMLASCLSGTKANRVVTIHTNILEAIKSPFLGPIKYFLYRQTFKLANHVIVPSEGIKNMMVKYFNILENKVKIIPHPLPVAKITQMANEPLEPNFTDKKYILAVGRLTEAKGYQYLLKAYKIISLTAPHYLVILGIGEKKEMLQTLTDDLGLSDRIIFAGFQKNPYKYMKNAELFVLSSLWESFAIVLSEAMLCGVPVISTDCPSGPAELIRHEVNGLLVKPCDINALVNAMNRLLTNKHKAEKFRTEGLKKAYTLNLDRIIPLYEKLFE